MKLREWNEADKAPAKTRFVKNEIELSEKRMRNILDFRCKKVRREMTALTVACAVITSIDIVIHFVMYRSHNHKPR